MSEHVVLANLTDSMLKVLHLQRFREHSLLLASSCGMECEQVDQDFQNTDYFDEVTLQEVAKSFHKTKIFYVCGW
jgi:hypothetical protein